ncbi:L-fuculokinase [Endozoicomonas sp. 4G]|uniref:L-fuculokinase n=1 Tax=Endozoicomonas sp. 4G TaxID=2872754 RepID=UPI002078A342|nr:L-fuculokinase [Endozoicomonas sp. 4G]
MTHDAVIVLDCGATNVRAIAVDVKGTVLAKASQPNITVPAEENPDWHQWPVEGIFEKFSDCCRQIMKDISPERIKGVTVTTFGVDGALIDRQGNPIYPVISWKCPRTNDSLQHLKQYLDPDKVVTESGVGHFAFNTLNKLIWFKENRPELLADAHGWLFISSLFNHKLTGRLTTDATMAGTAQLTDLKSQTFNTRILSAIGIESDFFPEMVQAGEMIGHLLPEAAAKLGLPAGILVISSGHDTQFAVFGSGAEKGQPVLSSGTWEILMVRSSEISGLAPDMFDNGFTCEWDSHKNHYNPGIQWLASGVLEWVGRQFYPDVTGSEKYKKMISEASAVPEKSHGITFNPTFLPDGNGRTHGAISGLSLNTERGAIYRSALEALSKKLKSSLHQLEQIGQFSASEIILVGGGSKNPLWNQIKADTLQLPIKILKESETTVLGASMFAMSGAGLYDSPEAARVAFDIQYETIQPNV